MGKKRYWHRKQLEITGNSVPNTLGRRRNSKEKDPWKNGYTGFISHWFSILLHRISTMIITPKTKRKEKVPGTVPGTESTKEEIVFEIRVRELCAFIVFVNLLSLWIVNTEFVPDEYWQSTEVAHKHVFGQGHLTWEWDYGLRSYLFPMIHMGYFKCLKYLGLDYPSVMIYGSRLVNTILMIVGQCYFFLANAMTYGVISSLYSVLLMLCSWFVFYCSSRLITNTTEMSLNMISLYYFQTGKIKTFIFLLALNFSVRPTAIVPWVPQLCVIVTKTPRKILPCFIVGIITLAILTYIDSYMYGYYVLPIWNFVRFNVLQGRSSEFGTHPLFWYVYNALPSILLLDSYTLFEMFYKVRNLPRYFLPMTSITTFIAFFSIVGHKEIRFVLPVLPFVYAVMGDYIYENVRLQNEGKKMNEYKFLTKSMWISLILHIMVGMYLCTEHQGAIKPASQFINNDSVQHGKEFPKIWIMMPCYSVPVHTYMHNPKAEFEYFTCGPSKMGLEEKMPNFQPDSFSRINLNVFFQDKLVKQGKTPPDYIMVYSGISQKVRNIAKSFHHNYERCFRMGHTRIDETLHPKDVHVLCRTK